METQLRLLLAKIGDMTTGSAFNLNLGKITSGSDMGQWLKSLSFQEWKRAERRARWVPEDGDSDFRPERFPELRRKYAAEKKKAEEEGRLRTERIQRLLAKWSQEAKEGDHEPLCKKPRMSVGTEDQGQEEDSEDEESEDEEEAGEIQPPL